MGSKGRCPTRQDEEEVVITGLFQAGNLSFEFAVCHFGSPKLAKAEGEGQELGRSFLSFADN